MYPTLGDLGARHICLTTTMLSPISLNLGLTLPSLLDSKRILVQTISYRCYIYTKVSSSISLFLPHMSYLIKTLHLR